MVQFSLEVGNVYLLNEYQDKFKDYTQTGKYGTIDELGLDQLQSVFNSGGCVSYVLIQKGDRKDFYMIYKDNVTEEYIYKKLKKKLGEVKC